jgi:ABC-type protease/lipase transport system fused ATPase/permease subunit
LNSLLTGFEQIEGHVRLIASPNPSDLSQQLLAEFPWAPAVTQEIEMQLALDRRLGDETFRMPPTILIGPSGSGKSRFARRLGELSNLPGTILLAGGACRATVKTDPRRQ